VPSLIILLFRPCKRVLTDYPGRVIVRWVLFNRARARCRCRRSPSSRDRL